MLFRSLLHHETLQLRFELIRISPPSNLLFETARYLGSLDRWTDPEKLARKIELDLDRDLSTLRTLRRKLLDDFRRIHTDLTSGTEQHGISDRLLDTRFREIGVMLKEAIEDFSTTLPNLDVAMREVVAYIKRRYTQIDMKPFIVTSGASNYKIRTLDATNEYFDECEYLEIARDNSLWGSVFHLLDSLGKVRFFLRHDLDWMEKPPWDRLRKRMQEAGFNCELVERGGKSQFINALHKLDADSFRLHCLRVHAHLLDSRDEESAQRPATVLPPPTSPAPEVPAPVEIQPPPTWQPGEQPNVSPEYSVPFEAMRVPPGAPDPKTDTQKIQP